MVKYYCDLCNSKITNNDEYFLPIEYESGLVVSTSKNKDFMLNRQIMYLPEKYHLCENCAKIIYLFIKGMKNEERRNK